MRCNPDPLKIPCHRVVSGTGELTGYSLSGGISRKKKMLIDEGVIFNKDRVDLRLCLWSKEMNSKLPDLTLIPGVGKSIEHDLNRLGIHFISDLKNNDPERLYNRLVQLSGHPIDRCVLYVFREAVYYASSVRHDPEKLKWWNWSDKKMN